MLCPGNGAASTKCSCECAESCGSQDSHCHSEYLYEIDANPVALVNGSNGGWQVGYVYRGGQLLAQYSGGTTYFAHADHLGSTRVLTDINGSGYDNYDYLPFGETRSGGWGTTHKFTGDERDSETGLDHTLFRQYSSALGRWSTPDPLAGDISDPQSLNRYSYVKNSPLIGVDPLGLDTFLSENCTSYQQDYYTDGEYGGTDYFVPGPFCKGSIANNAATGGGGGNGGGDGGSTTGGGGGASGGGTDAFNSCFIKLTNDTSLQTTFHAGNGFLAGALLGNTFGSLYQLGQSLPKHDAAGAAGNLASAGGSNLVGAAAKAASNVAVLDPVATSGAFTFSASATAIRIGISKTTTYAVSFPLAKVAGVVTSVLDIVNLPKLTYDGVSFVLSAASCAMRN